MIDLVSIRFPILQDPICLLEQYIIITINKITLISNVNPDVWKVLYKYPIMLGKIIIQSCVGPSLLASIVLKKRLLFRRCVANVGPTTVNRMLLGKCQHATLTCSQQNQPWTYVGPTATMMGVWSFRDVTLLMLGNNEIPERIRKCEIQEHLHEVGSTLG